MEVCQVIADVILLRCSYYHEAGDDSTLIRKRIREESSSAFAMQGC